MAGQRDLFDAPLDRTLGRVPPGFLKGLCPASSFGGTCNSALLSTTQLLDRAAAPTPLDRTAASASQFGGTLGGATIKPARSPGLAASSNVVHISAPPYATGSAPPRASGSDRGGLQAPRSAHSALWAPRPPSERQQPFGLAEPSRRGLPRICEASTLTASAACKGGARASSAPAPRGSDPAAGKASFLWAERMQQQQQRGGAPAGQPSTPAPERRGSVERPGSKR